MTLPTALHPPAGAGCRHCGGEVGAGAVFCCGGCEAAFALIGDMGLSAFYRQRSLAGNGRRQRPDDSFQETRLEAWVRVAGPKRSELVLMIDGLNCGACVWLIEQFLFRQPGVLQARVSLSSRRLTLAWDPGITRAEILVAGVQRLGYRLVPLELSCLNSRDEEELRHLLRCLAVAGFAAGNIMLLSVSVWLGADGGMAPGTRDLLHWISALIAIPAVAYAGRPFFRNAWQALRAGRTNMDVPISLAIVLAPVLSLYETFTGGRHAYFDSAVTLLFFLLIGRFLDYRARRAARATAEQLLALNAEAATLVEADGTLRDVHPRDLSPGQRVLVAPGARIPADGRIALGASRIDLQLISGEADPVDASIGGEVFAGTLNLDAALTVIVERVGESTLLADIIRLMEAAEARRGRFVRIAERVARYYSPVVHLTALATFLAWVLVGGMAWQEALLVAVAVLIITCPCALALAVPAVQVVASQRLLRAGVLMKSADALERLCLVDHVVFDKTGTVTLGRPRLAFCSNPAMLAKAAGIAAASRHPLASALRRAAGIFVANEGVREIAGLGLEWNGPDGTWRLGSARFTGEAALPGCAQTLWLKDPRGNATQFEFHDPPRPDAGAVIGRLRRAMPVEICSGDRQETVADVAARVGVSDFLGGQMPADKVRRLEDLRKAGRHVLMVGDGLNDAPALRAAFVSIAPGSGADISQSAADLVFQGDRLGGVELAISVAKAADRLVRQNLGLALTYNLAAVPLAISGFVTPLVAAIAMSSSSLLVILNALRLGRYGNGDEK